MQGNRGECCGVKFPLPRRARRHDPRACIAHDSTGWFKYSAVILARLRFGVATRRLVLLVPR